MGTLVQPAPWKATGLEGDKMNPEAVAFHINHVLGEIQKYCGDVMGKGLDYIWFDSYEAGIPTLDAADARGIKTRRGYDITPFLDYVISGEGRLKGLVFSADVSCPH